MGRLDFALTEVFAQVLPDRVDGGTVSWRSILHSSISCVLGSLHANLAHDSHLISHVRVSLHSILADSLFVSKWVVQVSDLRSVVAIVRL